MTSRDAALVRERLEKVLEAFDGVHVLVVGNDADGQQVVVGRVGTATATRDEVRAVLPAAIAASEAGG